MNLNRNSTPGNQRTPFNRAGGYTAAASWLALDPDNETLIFRKFDRLAVLNLLYLQSEILELEKQIDQLHDETVAPCEMDIKDAASRWETLISQYTTFTENRPVESERERLVLDTARRRMELILDLRVKIKEYHEALLLQTEVAKLRRPESRVLKAVKHFFTCGDGYLHPILGGKAKTFLDDKQDLVALKQPEGTDYISNLLRRHWAQEKEATSIQEDGKGTYYARYNERSIQIAINTITIIIAAVFLIGSVATFSFLENKAAQLGALTGYTVAFSICIGLITNARRVEIFTATAAYAAVLVVFMGTEGVTSSNT